MQNRLCQGILKLAIKELHIEKNDYEIYEPDFWEKINFKTFYAQNYFQKVCSRSILNTLNVSEINKSRKKSLKSAQICTFSKIRTVGRTVISIKPFQKKKKF